MATEVEGAGVRQPRRYVDWPYVLGLAVLPVVVVGVLFGIAAIQGLTRYNPAYFTADYLTLYDTPGSVARALEVALRDGDQQLLHELQATKRAPAAFAAQPKLIFVFLLSVQGDYFQYLYFNTDSFIRVTENVKQHDGRYVEVPSNLYYYMDSGQWTTVAAPIAATWWILLAVYTLATYVYRRMATARQRMFNR